MRTKSFDNPLARQSIAARIAKLQPDSPRQWGKMSPHQMLCHLSDGYFAVIGERAVSSQKLPIPRPILKWFVLNAPWPKGVPTRPEIDQLLGGSPPTEFEADRRTLLQAIDRFCACPDSVRAPHPTLGKLNHRDWMRWAYLHADHHLKQFSV